MKNRETNTKLLNGDISKLTAGDEHYMAYVGPPTQYDFMGASQFRLLCTLGLRADHYLLDFGCGSLRAGRFFINYLDKERYYGIEPNKWLIKEGIQHNVGHDLAKIKRPTFDHNDKFSVNFGLKFDFVLAQSIFSHTGKDLIQTALRSMQETLNENGIIAATFVEGHDCAETGWIYHTSVTYKNRTIKNFAREAGLFATRIPWYHPRQTWYILSKNKNLLPSRRMKSYLKGAVLYDPEFYASWKNSHRLIEKIKHTGKRNIPPSFRQLIKKWTRHE